MLAPSIDSSCLPKSFEEPLPPPSSPPTFSPVENPVSYIKLNENRAVARAFICGLPQSLTRTYNETFPGFNNWHTLATFIDVCMIFDMQMLICTHIFSL